MTTALFLIVCGFLPPPVEDYQISGVIVDHLTKRPLRHVIVQLGETGSNTNPSATTAANGRFTFPHLQKGRYLLMAARRGQPLESLDGDGSYSTPVVVDGLQKTDQIVFPLQQRGSISGMVMGEDDEPVRAAEITVFQQRILQGETRIVTKAGGFLTNSAGRFHFGHLEGGRYYVAVGATPWFSEPRYAVVYPVTFSGNTTDPNGAQPINLAEGASANLQIKLHTAPGIRVKVYGHRHALQMWAQGPGSTRVRVPYNLNHASVMGIDPEELTGTEMVNFAAGRYQIIDEAVGGRGQLVDFHDGGKFSAEAMPHASIGGIVLFAGAPPPADLELFLNPGLHARIAADAIFKFDRVPPGEYSVTFSNSAFTVSDLKADGIRIVDDLIEVPASGAVDLTVKAAGTETLANLRGVAIRDSRGARGAMVLLLPEDLRRGSLIRRDQSATDGSFRLTKIMPGGYTLIAIDDGRDLAYQEPSVIKNYLPGGLSITIPLEGNEQLKVPVQTRKR